MVCWLYNLKMLKISMFILLMLDIVADNLSDLQSDTAVRLRFFIFLKYGLLAVHLVN